MVDFTCESFDAKAQTFPADKRRLEGNRDSMQRDGRHD